MEKKYNFIYWFLIFIFLTVIVSSGMAINDIEGLNTTQKSQASHIDDIENGVIIVLSLTLVLGVTRYYGMEILSFALCVSILIISSISLEKTVDSLRSAPSGNQPKTSLQISTVAFVSSLIISVSILLNHLYILQKFFNGFLKKDKKTKE